MTENIIDDLIGMQDEPIVSEENETLLAQITSITRTSEFAPMELDDERLDGLIECLGNQENFANEVNHLAEGLERVKSIIIKDDNDEDEDYI